MSVKIDENGNRIAFINKDDQDEFFSRSKDPIVEKMITKIRERSKNGQEKYGQTMQEEVDTDVKNFLDYITDVEEELFDAIIYMQAFKAAMVKKGFKHKLFENEDRTRNT